MSFSRPTPDLQGYAKAQDYLRTNFGQQVRFYGPAAMLYDPSIPASEFDDEGIPLDPLAGASAVNADSTVAIENLTVLGTAIVNTVFKPLQTSIMRRDQTFEQQLAIRSGLNKDLIVDLDDMPLASGASHFEVGKTLDDGTWVPEDGELWKVVNAKIDSFGTIERYIVYGQGTL